MPATMTIARIGSERASTSVSSSFRSATKTSVGRVSTRGTRRHHARTRACAASEPPSASASAIAPGLAGFSLTRRAYRPEGYDSAGTSASIRSKRPPRRGGCRRRPSRPRRRGSPPPTRGGWRRSRGARISRRARRHGARVTRSTRARRPRPTAARTAERLRVVRRSSIAPSSMGGSDRRAAFGEQRNGRHSETMPLATYRPCASGPARRAGT